MKWLCWLPLLCLLGVEWYASGFDGQGAWATAPLFLLPFFASVSIALMGVVDAIAARRRGEPLGAAPMHAAVAVGPVLWLCVRRFVV